MSPKRRKVGAEVDRARRPRHLDPRRGLRIRKSEMEYRLVAAEEPIRETKLPSLPPQSDDGPETVAVARRPRETESNPVSRGARGEIEVWGAAEVVDDHVERAASVEIRNRGPASEAVGNVLRRLPHAGLPHPEGAVAGAGHQGDILETEASEILEKKLHARVVGDPDLRKPVGVEVHEENGESACRRLLDQRFRHVAKSRAVRVSIERIRGARKAVGAAEDLDSKIVATGAEIDLRDVDIGTDVEVEEPVEIQIAEGSPSAPRVVLHSRLGLDESPVAVVAKERVSAQTGHVEIAVAVVVDIAHGAAERPAPVVYAGTSGDVVERESPAPAKESAADRRGRERAIGKEELPDAVVVEITAADTGPPHAGDRS